MKRSSLEFIAFKRAVEDAGYANLADFGARVLGLGYTTFHYKLTTGGFDMDQYHAILRAVNRPWEDLFGENAFGLKGVSSAPGARVTAEAPVKMEVKQEVKPVEKIEPKEKGDDAPPFQVLDIDLSIPSD